MPAVRLREIASLLVTLLMSAAASAATTCHIATGQLTFGTYHVSDPLPRDTHTTLQLSCTREGGPQHIAVSVALGPGGSGSIGQRALRQVGGTEQLPYQLFRDAARTAVWGDTPGVDTWEQTVSIPNKASQALSLTVFGRIPARQDPAPGLYTDQIIVSVTP